MGIDISTHFGKIADVKSPDFYRRFICTTPVGQREDHTREMKPYFEALGMNPCDLIFAEPVGPCDGHRNWDLFSFLYYGESVQPLLVDEEKLTKRKQGSIRLKNALEESLERVRIDDEIMFLFSDNVIIYGLHELLSFNYDAVVITEDVNDLNQKYIQHPEGKTYRDLFPENYFTTLKEAELNGWQIVVFSFS